MQSNKCFIDKFGTNNKHNMIENLGKNLTNEQEIHRKYLQENLYENLTNE